MGFLALLLYTALMFLRLGELYPTLAPLRLTAVGSALAVVLTLWDVLRGKGPSYRALQIYVLVLFALWAALSVVLAQSWLDGALQALVALTPGLMLFYLVVLNVDSLRRLRIYAGWLVLMCVLISVQGILAFHTGYHAEALVDRARVDASEDGSGAPQLEQGDATGDALSAEDSDEAETLPRVRHLGLLNDPNDLAQALVAMLPMILVVTLRRRSFGVRLAALAVAATMLYTVYLTHSRGGVVALAALVFVAVSERFGRILAVVMTGLGTAGFLLGGFAAGRKVSGDSSTMGRIEAWTEGFEMLRQSPLWGIGFGAFGDVNGLVAHNSYVHCLAELGLVGYSLWLSLIVATLMELFAAVRAGNADADADSNAAQEPDADHQAGDGVAGVRRDIALMASSFRLSLIGFLAAAYFLSRAYAFLLFLLLALPVALVDVSRRETGGPPQRLLPVLVASAVAVVLSVIVLNISVKIGIRLLMR